VKIYGGEKNLYLVKFLKSSKYKACCIKCWSVYLLCETQHAEGY